MILGPQKTEHGTTADRVAELLRDAFDLGYHVRMQGSIDFDLIPRSPMATATPVFLSLFHPPLSLH